LAAVKGLSAIFAIELVFLGKQVKFEVELDFFFEIFKTGQWSSLLKTSPCKKTG
jgi:hypothetical protein